MILWLLRKWAVYKLLREVRQREAFERHLRKLEDDVRILNLIQRVDEN